MTIFSTCSRWAGLAWIFFVLSGFLIGGILLDARTSPRFLDWRSVGATLLAVPLTYGLAKFSWIFFEHPLLQRGHAYKFFPAPAVSSADSERGPILRTVV